MSWLINRTRDAYEGLLATSMQPKLDRKSTRLNPSHGYISYAVFCLKKKKHTTARHDHESITIRLRRTPHPPPTLAPTRVSSSSSSSAPHASPPPRPLMPLTRPHHPC